MATRPIIALVTTFLLSGSALASMCGVAAEVRFESDSAVLDEEGLEKALEPIKAIQRKNALVAYIAVGYADTSEGDARQTILLSAARVARVAAHVAKNYPDLANLVHTEAHGTGPPVYDRAEQNRRVEIQAVCIVQPPYFDSKEKPIL